MPFFLYIAVHTFTNTPGSGPIFLSNLICQGSEKNLLECSSQPIGLHTCDHTQDVGIECEGERECALNMCVHVISFCF